MKALSAFLSENPSEQVSIIRSFSRVLKAKRNINRITTPLFGTLSHLVMEMKFDQPLNSYQKYFVNFFLFISLSSLSLFSFLSPFLSSLFLFPLFFSFYSFTSIIFHFIICSQ